MGCGKTEQTSTSQDLPDLLAVNEDGGIDLTIRDYLDRTYYDAEELFSMAQQEAALFNASYTGETAVVLSQTDYDKETRLASIVYHFYDVDTFYAFTGKKIFYGTITEAVSMGYYMEGLNLISTKGGESYSQMEILAKNPGIHVVVTDYPAILQGPTKILYYADNGVLLSGGKKMQTMVGNQKYSVIVLKK